MRNQRLLLFCVCLLALPGCSKEETTIDCNAVNLRFSTQVTDSECGVAQGIIEVIPSPGADILRYKIDDRPFQPGGLFTDLKPGNYIVTVENAAGCSYSENVFISSGISFRESVQPIIETYCAIPACHDGTGNIDFRVFSNLNPGDMKARTQSGNMPKEGSLTPEQIEAIACWADDGGKNN